MLPTTPIPRAGGTLNVAGVTTVANDQGQLPSITATVDEVNLGEVTAAVNSVLPSVDGTSGYVAFDTNQYYSESHFAVEAGLNLSYMNDAFKAGFSAKVVNNKTTNVIVSTFYQSYFTVTFTPPEHSYSVFRDGKDFEDPDYQLFEGNPPLYVSDVTYGRQILFFVHSSYGEDLVNQAMQAAYKGESDVTVSGHEDLKYSDILKESEVTYVERGGTDASAVNPIGQADDPEGFYKAVLDLMADAKAASYSTSSPAVPISYSLAYVGYPRPHGNSNHPAMSALSDSYDELTCHTIPAGAYDLRVKIKNYKEQAIVKVDGTTIGDFRASAGNQSISLNDQVADSDSHVLTLEIWRWDCTAPSHVEWQVLMDGSPKWKKTVDKGVIWTNFIPGPLSASTSWAYFCMNPAARATVSVNRSTGKVQLTKFETFP